MRSILFYITGHGFGHATRVIETINQLSDKAPDVLALIATSVPKWLFEQQVKGDFRYINSENDGTIGDDIQLRQSRGGL